MPSLAHLPHWSENIAKSTVGERHSSKLLSADTCSPSDCHECNLRDLLAGGKDRRRLSDACWPNWTNTTPRRNRSRGIPTSANSPRRVDQRARPRLSPSHRARTAA